MDPLFLLLIIGIPLVSQFVSSKLRQRFVYFSQQPMPITGYEAAERMLRQHGIHDVRVLPARGQLTDHYNPADKTIQLSEVVYGQRNVAAVAPATHECGHAVQDATEYPFLNLRSRMVPILKLSNLAIPVLAFGGAGVSEFAGSHSVALLFLIGLGLPALFSVITLPVEFDASRRALNWMRETGLADIPGGEGARKALFWAAMTYVVAALGSIVQAIAFARLFLKRR